MKAKELETLAIQHEIAEKIKFEISCGLRKDVNETEDHYLNRRDSCIVQEYEYELYECEGIVRFDKERVTARLAKKFSLTTDEVKTIIGL